jgi:PDZ domain-containing protein
MLQEGPAVARPPESQAIRLLVIIIVGLLVLALVAWLNVLARGYYVLSPGNAPVVTAASDCKAVGGGSFALPSGTPCVQLIVPAGQAHTDSGSIMMVDVLQGKPTIFQYVAYKLGWLSTFYGTDELIPNSVILGNGTASQLNCVDTQQAVQATSAAPVAALRRLGYTVTESDLGAQIDTVLPASAAAAAGVQCDDLVTAIDGHGVHTDVDLANAVRPHKPGDTIHLTVQRSTGSGATTTLTLTARLTGVPAIDHQPPHPNQPFLGIEFETRTNFNLPVDISAQVGSIGGPSDGLALTLGFIDTLSQGRLTGGHKVAATGTIDPNGNVGPIGGAAQKAVAVRKAGADVFLVPAANYADAKSQAGSMKVFAVSTLSQALADLQSIGGTLPPVRSNPAVTTSAMSG